MHRGQNYSVDGETDPFLKTNRQPLEGLAYFQLKKMHSKSAFLASRIYQMAQISVKVP